MISRPQSWPRAPTTVTSQPDASSYPVRPAAVTARDRAANPASRPAASWVPAAQASTWWVRFSRMTGQPASAAACRTTSSAGAPDTASSVNTWCSRSAARSSASWLSMMRPCTASVISMNWVSRSNMTSGSRCAAAAATRAGGRLRAYREPSSTASALMPTEARSAT